MNPSHSGHFGGSGTYLGDGIHCTHYTLKPVTNNLAFVKEDSHRGDDLVGSIDSLPNTVGYTDNPDNNSRGIYFEHISFDSLETRTYFLIISAETRMMGLSVEEYGKGSHLFSAEVRACIRGLPL